MKVGVLLPRSNAHPLIGSAFLEGIKVFLKNKYPVGNIELSAESVGFGGSEKEVYAKAEQLLIIDDVDILVAFIDEKILEILKPLSLATGKLTVVVNAGANHPVNWIPQHNIIHLSLQHSFLSALTGFAAAVSATNVNAGVASSFYDCGYLHLASMVNEFMKSKGIIKFHYIHNQLEKEVYHINELIQFLNDFSDTKNLLCIFDSKAADRFYNKLEENIITRDMHLFVSPMMLEENALSKLSEGYQFSITGYMPWHKNIPSEANQQFVEVYQQQTKKIPDLFALLGWELGMVLKEIDENAKDDIRNSDLIVDLLATKPLTGPRGLMQFDRETQFFVCPAIRCSIAAGTTELKMEYGIDIQNNWDEFRDQSTEGIISGWTNTYLCY